MTEQDKFYIEEDTGMDDASIDEVLNQQVDDDPVIDETQPREDWQLTANEEKLLAELLKKREKEDYIMKTFLALEQKPTESDIEVWKKQYGAIFFASFGDSENFIFRPLKRSEWRVLITKIGKLPEHKKVEAIVAVGVVWPKLNDAAINVLTAGVPESLKNLILEASNFMEPERAITLVRKL